MEDRLAIALPLTDEKVHSQFLDSFIRLRKPNFVYIRPAFPVGTTSNVSAVRNAIVRQALESDCTKILLLDTDQNFQDLVHYELIL